MRYERQCRHRGRLGGTGSLHSNVSVDLRSSAKRLLTPHPESVVDDQGDAVVMRNLRQLRKRRNIVLWIPDGFNKDGLRLIIDRGCECGGIRAFNKFDANVKSLQVDWRMGERQDGQVDKEGSALYL